MTDTTISQEDIASAMPRLLALRNALDDFICQLSSIDGSVVRLGFLCEETAAACRSEAPQVSRGLNGLSHDLRSFGLGIATGGRSFAALADDISRGFCGLRAAAMGHAFQRLAWSTACRLMDDPEVWGAVEAVEGELFSGLLREEPADPRPGDCVNFVLPGSRAEALIAGAGIALPNIIDVHGCGPECIRPSRRTSRRWQRYVAEWANEEPKNAA